MEEFNLLNELCRKFKYIPNEKNTNHFNLMNYGNLSVPVSLRELVVRSSLDCVETLRAECSYLNASFTLKVIESVAISLKYEGYIKRANEDNKRITRLDRKKIDWKEIIAGKNISNECSQRIKAVRPETFSQLRKITGVRPATVALVASTL